MDIADIDKINIVLGILVIFGFLLSNNITLTRTKKQSRPVQRVQTVKQPVQSKPQSKPIQKTTTRAVIKSSKPLVIQPLKTSSTKKIVGVSEQNLFRRNLQSKREQLRFNKFVNGGEFAQFSKDEPEDLSVSQIEEKNVFEQLFLNEV